MAEYFKSIRMLEVAFAVALTAVAIAFVLARFGDEAEDPRSDRPVAAITTAGPTASEQQ